MIRGEPIYLNGNDDLPKARVSRTNVTTGAAEPATGLAGLSFRLAATPTGAAIDASLSKAATEGWTEESIHRVYYAVFEGADLQTHLNNATYKGRDVYEIFSDGANVNVVTARKVMEHRP